MITVSSLPSLPVRSRAAGRVVTAALLAVALSACDSAPRTAGTIAGGERARAVISARAASRATASEALAGRPDGKQILFGDLHVHSTFSIDAFMYSLPVFNGEGAHPPADACDFARYCAGLDFFSINDHAEGLTPRLWRETIESIRECNRRAGDPANPDLVAFLGWEWSQTSRSPETHYGHKNVIFPGLADDEIPRRPISSISIASYETKPPPGFVMQGASGLVRLLGYGEYADVLSSMTSLAETPDCPSGVNTRDLPANCREWALDPVTLFRKLDEWGFETLVIPHGLAWGIHAPPGGTLAAQLDGAMHDPKRQRLIEIMSGHGNSEEFRPYAEYATNSDGVRVCPEPTADYEPCCWRAGEIMRSRCGDLDSAECDRRVAEAVQMALDGGVSPQMVFPDSDAADWLDCDQCRDCFKPAMTTRPMLTAQYGAALTSFASDGKRPAGKPRRFRWGFIASTDNHAARPGTGYKQYDRTIMTDAHGIADATSEKRIRSWLGSTQKDPQRPQSATTSRMFELFDTERKASFMYPGGIVAVHAAGRDRRSIWNALQRKEVYGTSGPRILLWFDLINGPHGSAPMGSEVSLAQPPVFEVRAAGALQQEPGCPADVARALSRERVHDLCRDECYHPGSQRQAISAIDVIRIRPQMRPDEPIAPLIEDPWRHFECAPSADGCRVRFTDPNFTRDSVYYVRALQQATPAINANNLRTTFDAAGNAIAIDECHGGPKTPASDDCLAPAQERAWSSPIYVDYEAAAARNDSQPQAATLD